MEETVTSEAIQRIATGYMASKELFVASEVGLFTQLADGPLELDELAARCGIPRRTARILADAMTALGLLDGSRGRYANRPEAQQYLSVPGRGGLGPFLRFWDQLSYPAWQGLAQAVRTGEPAGPGELDETRQLILSEGVEAITLGAAAALSDTFEFERYRRMLDLGGGTGSFLTAALAGRPGLSGTLFDLPPVAAIARRRLADSPVADRVEVIGGDLLKDALPRGHDVILLANVAHYFPPETNCTLLARIRCAAEPGTVLLMVDFWTDPTHTQPLLAVLLAGEFLTLLGGDVYSAEECGSWLADTGWEPRGQHPLDGPISLVLAEAV